MSITKDEAEALKFQAEAEKFQAEAKAAAAEARLKTADAQKAEYYAENARISLEATKRSEALTLASHHYHHELHFVAGVNEDSVEACVSQMAIWHRQDPYCPMTIRIDSQGGSVFDGNHLFDDISAYSLREWDTRDVPKGTHKTTVIVRGMAASMAGVLLQAADHRVMGPESWMLIHEISSFTGGKLSAIKDEAKFLEKMDDRAANIFVRRSGGKITKAAFNRRQLGKEWWLSSEEALSLGFIDEIA